MAGRLTTQPNIILLSADSLRADHLGCYGYPLATSPHIDAMAARGARCERAFVSALPTQPSHTSIFSGQHPLTHGVVAHGGTAKLPRDAPFVPEILLESGYTTCTIDTLFRERLWFARGYEYVIDPGVRHVYHGSVTQEELNDRAIQWIKSVPKGPFFLFIHYWDTHYPYAPPEEYRDLFYSGRDPFDPSIHTLDAWWDHPLGALARDTWLRTPNGVVTDPDYVTALYDGEIHYFDDGVGRLLAALEQLGLAENTLVALLGDHGESMTEHGIFFDHYGLYECTLRVPLIFHWPAGNLQAGRRLPDLAQLHDVAPTLLDAADVPAPFEMDGRSLLGVLRGEKQSLETRPVVALESTWQAKYCLRTERHKFITARQQDLLGTPARELYDLEADPGELHNLADVDRAAAGAFEAELESWIQSQLDLQGKTADPVKQEGPVMVNKWMGGRS